MMQWLRDRLLCDGDKEKRNDSVAFSRKELESAAFVEEEFLHKKIQKKENVFKDLTTKNSLRGR